MANMDEIYRDLTGVDIDVQRRLYDERGKGYYGEYLVFKELYPDLTGCCKILMNIQIPAGYGKTTEIDLLLIHETGLYVFEMKHYKGTIYGKTHDQNWTQYFRTAPNSKFYNPVRQNQYHINALQKMFPGIPVHSYIVFTNPECDLRVDCSESNVTVCRLSELNGYLQRLRRDAMLFDMDRINAIFNELTAFSPMTSKTVRVDGEVIPLYQYLNRIISDYSLEKESLKNAFQEAEKKERKKTTIAVSVASVLCAVAVVLAAWSCFQYRTYANDQIAAAQQELSAFAQKFEHVAPYNDGKITLTEGLITASDVQLEQSVDIVNAVNLKFTLNWSGEHYGLYISRNTKILVMCRDGSVKEYDLLERVFPNSRSGLSIGKGNTWYWAHTEYEFPRHELTGLDAEEISYIKLAGLDIWTTEEGSYEPVIVGNGYEVEIYRGE